MAVKLDVWGMIYHNIPLKDVTNIDILNIIYSVRDFLWKSHKERYKENFYTDIDVYVNIGPKLQNMSKNQGLIMILHKGV